MTTDDLQAEVESLQLNVRELAGRIRELEKYVDVVTSPLHKRIVWWLNGWRFNRVGRWRKQGGSDGN